MFLLHPKFLSLKSLQPLRFYKKLDGWLLGAGRPLRVKTKDKELWIKHSSKDDWIINPLLFNTDHWQLLCVFCGCRTDILYYVNDYRCRKCTKHLLPETSISGLVKAKRQAQINDFSMLQSPGTDRIAMRMHLESEGIVEPLLSPVPEEEAIKQIRYEKIVEVTPHLEPIKEGRLIWVKHRYIWVDGRA